MSAILGRAADGLKTLLGQVPSLKVTTINVEHIGADHGVDIRADIEVYGRRRSILCEVKPSGQPRITRLGALEIKNAAASVSKNAVPVFIAPYLTPDARALCRQLGVNFMDLEGNARIAFDGVFIERTVPTKPQVERRELRSLFKPRSARVLKVLLLDPERAWRVTDLAEAAQVSLGHVSNVRVGLIDREWAKVSKDGLRLSEPDALLDEWRADYSPAGERIGLYTTLHGKTAQDAARRALRTERTASAVFASFSASQWLAPYGRAATQYFYANEGGVRLLKEALRLEATARGENVVITVPKDDGLFLDVVEPAPGAFCTGAIQTYLDLSVAGERGREAADFLRQERLQWQR